MTRALVLSFLFPTIVSTGLWAQGVAGVVAELNTAERLSGAQILLFDLSGERRASVTTGDEGEFLVEVAEAGIYTLLVHQAGYKDRTADLALKTGELVEVRVNLAPAATQLEGVTVYGLTASAPEHREFLSRRHLPWNRSFDMQELEQLHAASATEVVRNYVLLPPGQCMMVYLDGRPSNLAGAGRGYIDVPIDWVYGIEVYRDFYDVPLEYRDAAGVGGEESAGGYPRAPRRCGAILIWSKHPPSEGVPKIWALGLGASAGFERGAFEFSWRPPDYDGYVTTVRLRVGEYDPWELLGSEKAVYEGFSPDRRPPYGSVYLGFQGPPPLLPWKSAVYSRIAGGASLYGGQTTGEVTEEGARQGSVATFFGLGAEVGVGARIPSWKIRPWIELHTGTEYLTRTGLRWIVPTAMIGVEFGGGLRP